MATVVILTARKDPTAPGPASAWFEADRPDLLSQALSRRGHDVAMWWANPAGDCVATEVDCCVLRTARGPNLERALAFRERGTAVVNDPDAHRIAGDKWTAYEVLRSQKIRQPPTALAGELTSAGRFVRKPRRGGGGHAVRRYDSTTDAPPPRSDEIDQVHLDVERDLRVTVIAGEITAAMARTPAPGEWRTNLSLGATFCAVDDVDEAARALAVAAARACNLVVSGIDLVWSKGCWWVLEINPATTLFAASRAQRDRTIAALCDAVDLALSSRQRDRTTEEP